MVSKKHKQSSLNWGVVAIGYAVAIGLVVLAFTWKPADSHKEVTDFQTCIEAGGTLMESFPEQCSLNGKPFTNDMPRPDTDNGSSKYVGLTEQAALDKAKAENKAARVVERDGESLPVDASFQPGRLNFTVKDGKVSSVLVEGAKR
jgi:hypothetical protein